MDFNDLNKAFRDKGRTLGSVESLTGGMFAEKVTSVPGASHFYKGGIVTYMTEEKVRLLGIPYTDVDEFGVVSEQVACKMAALGCAKLSSDYCISFTGNAGPEAMEGKAVGTVYVGICAYGKVVVAQLSCSGTRDEIRAQCIQFGVDFLIKQLQENN